MGGDFLYVYVANRAHLKQLSLIKGTVYPKGEFSFPFLLGASSLGSEMAVFPATWEKGKAKREEVDLI